MHILTAQAGRIDDGDEAVDLEQSPGDVVVLSAADSEITGFAAAAQAMPQNGPSLRLANILQLNHPYSVDLYAEKTLPGARFVLIRLLGGVEYWPYGIERISEAARADGFDLVIVPGDNRWDEKLARNSTVPLEFARRLWRYCSEGGPVNAANALKAIHHYLGHGEEAEAPLPLPRFGCLHGDDIISDPSGIGDVVAQSDAAVIPIVFYRSLVEAATVEPVHALAGALADEGLQPLPIFVASLKDAESAEFLREVFDAHPPEVVLNATAFAVSKAGRAHEPTPLDAPGRPVFQVIFSSSSREAWTESGRGLSIRDLAMHVVLPEIDGRITTRAVSFKEQSEFDPLTECRPVRYVADLERIAFVAKQVAAQARLSMTNAGDRKVALILANYPNRDGRIANGVGLDTPASAVNVLSAMQRNGYDVDGAPNSSHDLMDQLLAGPTNAVSGRVARRTTCRLPIGAYQKHFNQLPDDVRQSVVERWGKPSDDPQFVDNAFHLAVRQFGNAVVGIQPARGYNIDPKETYHDPDLVPPHNYFAFYFWLRYALGVHAVVHLGKHGNLEWLPGKALALSECCFPEAVLGRVPNIYPFIVNDPGEGCQAKRRTSAVIIDHLTPPMTRAESHGSAVELETLLDEYYLASGVDPRRAAYLEKEILNTAAREGIDQDAGAETTDDSDTALARIDAHLCDLKELQIRDGLHTLGIAPDSQQLTDLLVAIARVPRGSNPGEASLHRVIASDLGLDDFDPLDCEYADPWNGSRPDVLSDLSDAIWRTAGDTIERIEVLATKLVSGDQLPDPCWKDTESVLSWIDRDLRPQITGSGPAEIVSTLSALDGRFVPPGPSGAPTRGRPDVLPTGRNFYAVDVRAVPSETAWRLGALSADRLAERYFQDEGEWPRAMVLTCWGTSNMRTGGDDIAQALALIGVKPKWEPASGRVTGFEITRLSELGRPRIDVTLRISGFFRDAFPHQIDLFDSAVQAVANLDEDTEANPIAERVRRETADLIRNGLSEEKAARAASYRVFGAMPGAYGAGLQALIDEKLWSNRADFAEAFLTWGGFAYGAGTEGTAARDGLETRLRSVDAVVQNQDNREHDLLDSDDYYQFEGGLAATVETLRGQAPRVFHNDHSRPERPVIRSLEEEIARVVRGRAANPKWITGIMRHGYKGAFEIAATVDYLFAFAATTNAVRDHHFDQLYAAYIADENVANFMADVNASALREVAARFLEAIERGLWTPRFNSAHARLMEFAEEFQTEIAS